MSGTRSGGGPDDRETGSWATETLPLSVRKELLERELQKLGLRKAAHGSGASSHEAGAQPPSPGHPQADSDAGTPGGGHGD